ncbi:hypothetical protein [Zavarzinia sp.]|uniref:hypothetical protein n=1 Tax=Zavarzinia sp. TaxID=2027920 RepID=UPI003BB5C344
MEDHVSHEDWYDAEVAPKLAELSKACLARGVGFIALVAYDGQGSVGRTIAIPESTALMIRMADALARCWLPGGRADIDMFIRALVKHAKTYGHSSMFLAQMGIPASPADGETVN